MLLSFIAGADKIPEYYKLFAPFLAAVSRMKFAAIPLFSMLFKLLIELARNFVVRADYGFAYY